MDHPTDAPIGRPDGAPADAPADPATDALIDELLSAGGVRRNRELVMPQVLQPRGKLILRGRLDSAMLGARLNIDRPTGRQDSCCDQQERKKPVIEYESHFCTSTFFGHRPLSGKAIAE